MPDHDGSKDAVSQGESGDQLGSVIAWLRAAPEWDDVAQAAALATLYSRKASDPAGVPEAELQRISERLGSSVVQLLFIVGAIDGHVILRDRGDDAGLTVELTEAGKKYVEAMPGFPLTKSSSPPETTAVVA